MHHITKSCVLYAQQSQIGQGMKERKQRLFPKVHGLSVAIRKRTKTKLKPAYLLITRHEHVQVVMFRSSLQTFFLSKNEGESFAAE